MWRSVLGLAGCNDTDNHERMAEQKYHELRAELHAVEGKAMVLSSDRNYYRSQRNKYKAWFDKVSDKYHKLSIDYNKLSEDARAISNELNAAKQKLVKFSTQNQTLNVNLQQAVERENSTLMAKSTLQQQVGDLKKDIAQMAQSSGDITDDYIREQMAAIFARLQNFVVRYYRTCKLDFSCAGSDVHDLLTFIAPNAARTLNVKRTHLITAVIIQVTLRHANVDHFFGISKSPTLAGAITFAKSLPRQRSMADRKSWLKTTDQILNAQHSDVLNEARAELLNKVLNEVYDALFDATSISWSEEIVTELAGIVETFLAFYRELEVQRTVLHFHHCYAISSKGDPLSFQLTKHEDVSYADDEGKLQGLPIDVAVFPGVFKSTDAFGNKLERPLVIVKAKAVPRAPDEPATHAPGDDCGSEESDL